MKKYIVLIGLIFFLANCTSDDNTSENEDTTPVGEITYSKGVFTSGAHTTTGNASINSKKTALQLSKFKTDAGPKLVVYLTTEVGSSDYVSLGDLKGIDGDYTYLIPSNTNLDKYNIVDIWCVDFSVSFGHAVLKK